MKAPRWLALVAAVAATIAVAAALNPALTSLHALDHIERHGPEEREGHGQDEPQCDICRSLVQARWALVATLPTLPSAPTAAFRLAPTDESVPQARRVFASLAPRAPPHG